MEIQLADTFAALGNATRFAIVDRLLKEGELPAGELAVRGVSPPAMSHHFRVLRDAGIIEHRADAQRRLYSVRPEAIRAVSEWAITYRQFWEQSLDRLGNAIAKGKRK